MGHQGRPFDARKKEEQKEKQMKGQTKLNCFFKKKQGEPLLLPPEVLEEEVDVPKGPQKSFVVAEIMKTNAMLFPYAEPRKASDHKLCNAISRTELRLYRAVYYYFNRLLEHKKNLTAKKGKKGLQKITKAKEPNNIRVQASEMVIETFVLSFDRRRTKTTYITRWWKNRRRARCSS